MEILATEGLQAWNGYIASTEHSHDYWIEAHRQQFTATKPDFPAVVFPPPLFDVKYLESAGDVGLRLLDLLLSLPDRIFGGDVAKMLAFQGVQPEEAAFLEAFYTPRFLSTIAKFSRPDLLICNDGVKAVEMNILPAIGGPGLCDRIANEFRATPYFRYLESQGLRLHAENVMAFWHRALRSVIRRKPNNKPLVFFEALVTPSELANPYPFHEDFLEPIRQFGFQVETGLIQNLQVRPEGVFHGDIQVDVIYTMFAYHEINEIGLPKRIFLDLAKADEALLVDFIAPPLGVVFDNKANFELLTAPEYAHLYSLQEREFICRYVPRTWRMTTALRDEAINNQGNYVLKPTAEFGGKSVYIGASSSSEEWHNCIDLACTTGQQFILQECIEDLWVYRTNDGDTEQQWSICIGPLLLGQCYSGTLIRQAINTDGTPVINLGRGAELGIGFTATPLSTETM